MNKESIKNNDYPWVLPYYKNLGDTLGPVSSQRQQKIGIKTSGIYDYNIVLFRWANNPEMKVDFFLDAHGIVFLFEEIEIKRNWAKPLAWLWDFSLRACKYKAIGQLTAGELRKLLRSHCKLVGSHFGAAGRLNKFLIKLPPDSIFDEKCMTEFLKKGGVKLRE